MTANAKFDSKCDKLAKPTNQASQIHKRGTLMSFIEKSLFDLRKSSFDWTWRFSTSIICHKRNSIHIRLFPRQPTTLLVQVSAKWESAKWDTEKASAVNIQQKIIFDKRRVRACVCVSACVSVCVCVCVSVGVCACVCVCVRERPESKRASERVYKIRDIVGVWKSFPIYPHLRK